MATTAELLVVDASVATKWYLTDEPDAEIAAGVLNRFGRGEVALIAPQQIRAEVPSAITVATRMIPRGQTDPRRTVEQGARAIADFLALSLPTIDDDRLVADAYVAAQQHGCAFYDALYLALAQRLGVRLVLADQRFYTLIRHLSLAVWLADYRPQ